MNEVEIANFRIERLEAAIDFVSDGDRTAFGRRLGYKDGAFIRQMLSGNRPISERTINKIERLPKMQGWFALQTLGDHTTRKAGVNNVESIEARLHSEVASKYNSIGDAARRVVDLVLRGEHDPLPVWATRPLVSAVDTAIAVAEMSIQPHKNRPKQVRR